MTLSKAADLVIHQLLNWLILIIKMLPNLVVAAIVLVVLWLLSIPAGRFVKDIMQRFSRRERIPKLLGRLARLVVIAAGVILSLDILKLDKAVASVLAGLGIVGFALSFASKDIATNFMSGLLLTFSRPFHIGDLIRSKDFYGLIQEVDMRSTTGYSLEGETVILPNKELVANSIINYTEGDKSLIILNAAVTYKNDLQVAEELAVTAIKSLELCSSERPIDFLYRDFGSNTIAFTIRFWTDKGFKTVLQARSEAIKAIKKTFADHEIAMVP